MKYRGNTILIQKPAGTGKSNLAKAVAEGFGFWVEVTIEDLKTPFRLGQTLTKSPQTVIVKEFDPTPENIRIAEDIVQLDMVCIECMGKPTMKHNAPNYIFVTNNMSPISIGTREQRFMIWDES